MAVATSPASFFPRNTAGRQPGKINESGDPAAPRIDNGSF